MLNKIDIPTHSNDTSLRGTAGHRVNPHNILLEISTHKKILVTYHVYYYS